MPSNPNQPVQKLDITIATGDDDVRNASHVFSTVGVVQGQTVNEFSVDLNNGATWPGRSTNTASMDLPAGTTLGDIRWFGIRFSSGQNNPFETQDNWNMNSVKAEYPVDGGNSVLLEQSGLPLIRFTGARSEWRISLF